MHVIALLKLTNVRSLQLEAMPAALVERDRVVTHRLTLEPPLQRDAESSRKTPKRKAAEASLEQRYSPSKDGQLSEVDETVDAQHICKRQRKEQMTDLTAQQVAACLQPCQVSDQHQICNNEHHSSCARCHPAETAAAIQWCASPVSVQSVDWSTVCSNVPAACTGASCMHQHSSMPGYHLPSGLSAYLVTNTNQLPEALRILERSMQVSSRHASVTAGS